MKVRSIDFGDNGLPSSATFTASIDELAFLTQILGEQSYSSREQIMRGAGDLETYFDITGSIWNPYWEDGVDDYLRGRK